MGKKLSSYKRLDKGIERRGYHFHCDGCNSAHGVFIDGKGTPNWLFNKNEDKPTFSPSILVTGGDENGKTICHSYVENGQIRYLNDCTHHLKGQTVELPDF